jgi:hypothetical protein
MKKLITMSLFRQICQVGTSAVLLAADVLPAGLTSGRNPAGPLIALFGGKKRELEWRAIILTIKPSSVVIPLLSLAV